MAAPYRGYRLHILAGSLRPVLNRDPGSCGMRRSAFLEAGSDLRRGPTTHRPADKKRAPVVWTDAESHIERRKRDVPTLIGTHFPVIWFPIPPQTKHVFSPNSENCCRTTAFCSTRENRRPAVRSIKGKKRGACRLDRRRVTHRKEKKRCTYTDRDTFFNHIIPHTPENQTCFFHQRGFFRRERWVELAMPTI